MMKTFTIILLINFLILCGNGSTSTYTDYIKTYLIDLQEKFDFLLAISGMNSTCSQHLRMFINDLIARKEWALQMVDASAKLQPGLFRGNIVQIGNFDQCLSIVENIDDELIQGQYCSVVVVPNSKNSADFNHFLNLDQLTDVLSIEKSDKLSRVLKVFQLTYGVCIPMTCSIENLQEIWNYIEFALGLPVHIVFFNYLCSHKGKVLETFYFDYYIFAFFATIFTMMVLSTLYDYFIYRNKHKENEQSYLVSFSLYSNAKDLLFIRKVDTEQADLRCLHGLKVISMLWILLGHRFVLNMILPNVNSLYIFEWKKNIESVLIIGAAFNVDTFFLISGLLTSYTYLKKHRQSISLNLFQYYTFRCARLMPALFATILFYIGVFKYLGDGPFWYATIYKTTTSCMNTWLSTLFFLQNYADFDYQCVDQAWYLAVDSQLYLVSPLVLYGLRNNPRKTFLCASLVGIISVIYTYTVTLKYNYGSIYFEGNSDFYRYVYQSTFVRLPTWLIGVFFGYFIYKYNKIKIPKILNFILGTMSISILVIILLSHLLITRNQYCSTRAAVFNSMSKPFWGLAIGLIVFSCATGNGGTINNILTLPFFAILGRLSYSFYLVHMGVGYFLAGTLRTFGSYSNIKGYHEFWGDLVFAMVPTVILYFMFEAPSIAIGKLFIQNMNTNKIKNINKETNTETSKKDSDNVKNFFICLFSYDKVATERQKLM